MIYSQISILLLQGALVAFLILLLFRLQKRLGIGILFVCLGLFQFVQIFSPSTMAVSITNDFVVYPGSSVLFTASLFVLLIVYMKEEAKQTENLIYILLIVNVVMSTFLLTFDWNYTEVSTFNILNVPTNLFDISAWVLFVGTIALFLDTLLIIIIFEFISKQIRFLFLQICFTMLIVVSFDTVFFSMIAFWDSDNLKTILISGLVSKVFFAVFYSIIFYCYLRYFNVITKKSFFSKTQGVFKSLTYKRKLKKMVNRIKMVEKKRIDKLTANGKELYFQNKDKGKRAIELSLANIELAYQHKERGKRAVELALANIELAFQNEEKEKRAVELAHANIELAFQNEEKEKRADELEIANKELAYQNKEKEKRADELAAANGELAYQNGEKEKRADELAAANGELAYQNGEKEKRADELDIANKKLAFQNEEKDKRAYELVLANKKLAFQNEERKRRAKELRHFIETANAPIFGINSKGLINEWNQTSEKITGFTKKEVLGKDLIRTYITEDYRESVKKVLDDALLGKETANFEFPLFTKEGKPVMVLLNSTTARNSIGEITGVLGVGQDITELVSYRKDLEFKVNERTIKLNESLKKEIELNELKSRFIATASHEFRTPLSIINFAAGVIKKYWDKMEPAAMEEKLIKIEDQVLHMTALLEDILIFGQAEAGEISNKPLNLNLGDFICKIIEEVYSSTNKSHEILLVDNEGLKKADILIDEKLGRNIFGNLLSNAIKFSPDAKKITVELVSEQDNIIISITDYGIGILESDLKNIFKPFSRGENVDLIQGTGLGLSIVKESVDLIGGEIVINSKVGKGTTFIVKIPKT